MKWTMIGLGIALLVALNSTPSQRISLMDSPLPPLQEDKIELKWLREGEEAPFDGLLLNEYTYERIRLKLWESDLGL